MTGGGNEVEAAVHPVVWHQSAVHPGLCIEEVLTLAVDVVDDRLPAARWKGKPRLLCMAIIRREGRTDGK